MKTSQLPEPNYQLFPGRCQPAARGDNRQSEDRIGMTVQQRLDDATHIRVQTHRITFCPRFCQKTAHGQLALLTYHISMMTGQQLLLAIRSRLHMGFIEHSLRRLERMI